MLEFAKQYIQKIDRQSADLSETLAQLRAMSLDEFGALHLELPNPELPHLSKILPQATPEQVQKTWTGSSGLVLLQQSTTFVRSLVNDYMVLTGRNIGAARVLDFGCGWARLLRLMPYYVAPENLYGCDPMDNSLEHARAARPLAHLAKSDKRPTDLPFPGVAFDLIYAFSVFTHIPAPVAAASLAAFRKRLAPGGLVAITVRPPEFWPFISQAHQRDYSEQAAAHAAEGYGYFGHHGREDEYGETSMSAAFIAKTFPEWSIVRIGHSLADPYQVVVYLKPRA